LGHGFDQLPRRHDRRGHVISSRRSDAAVVAVVLAPMALAGVARADSVPIPRPRPDLERRLAPSAAAPQSETWQSPLATAKSGPEWSDCRQRLTADIAAIQALPAISAPGGCGAEDVVLLEAVITKNKIRVAVTPPATMRCSFAEAVIHWVREDAAPAAASLGAPLRAIANYASYECRSRNRILGATLSEHGKANALDIRALVLANGEVVNPTDPTVAKEVRERLKSSACARFTTVLGPASDGYHENHVHLDLAERHHGVRLCHWLVRDRADVAPPIPRPRPPAADARRLE
jgi:hypothetical protein